MTKHFRIFTSEMGEFRERDKYEFVAEFADNKHAADFARNLLEETNHEKDIIFMECDVETPSTDGYIPVVLNVMGEYMLAEEIVDLNPVEKPMLKPYKPKKPLTKEPKRKVIVD